MAQSSLLGGERALRESKGRDTAALGPSDSSDSGSDLAGLEDPETTDPALPVDAALSEDSPHGLLGSESLSGSASDAAGTGERRSAGSDAGTQEARDIGVDRVFVPVEAADPSDDEDPDLSFIDDIQAEDLATEEEGEEDGEDEESEDAEGRPPTERAGPPPVPPQPNPAPDEPDTPESPEPPADETDALGRPVPVLLRRKP
jgi:hypothetical protein